MDSVDPVVEHGAHTVVEPVVDPVVRRGEFRTALHELRRAQKTSKGVSLYSRFINRPAGRVLAAAAHRLGLTPNQVTLLSAACSFAGVAVLALFEPSWTLGAAVCAALVIGFALDSADGQLARLRRESSAAGEWLDHVVDCAKITALHAAVLVSFDRFFELPGRGWLLLPLAFQFAAVLIFFGGLLTDQLKRAQAAAARAAAAAQAPPEPPAPAPSAPPSRVRALALLPVDYGVFCFVFLLLGSERLFLTGYALLFAVNALFLVAFLVKWFRELSAPHAG